LRANSDIGQLTSSWLNSSTEVHATSLSSLAITSAPASLNDTYDADSCRSSWITWLSTLAEHQLVVSRITTLDKSFGYTWDATPSGASVTSRGINTITPGPPYVKCDGVPRVSGSTTEILDVYVDGEYIIDTFVLSNTSSIVHRRKFSEPLPTCTIHRTDCARQWNELTSAFTTWTPTFSQVCSPSGLPLNNTLCSKLLLPFKWNKEYIEFNNSLNIESLFDELFSGDMSWGVPERLWDKVFGGCPQAQVISMSQCIYNTYMSRRTDLLDVANFIKTAEMMKAKGNCQLKGGQFIVFFFPPKNAPSSRDICANDGWGESLPPETVLTSPMGTAIITTISFAASYSGMLCSLSKVFNANTSKGDLGGSTKYPNMASPSIRTGRWTFVSPSVYLAFDKITADYGCYGFDVRSDGILTLPASELSSIVWGSKCSSNSVTSFCKSGPVAREFNLLDLTPPIPHMPFRGAASLRQEINFRTEEREKNITIIDGVYNPMIAFPTALTKIHPLFKGCTYSPRSDLWDTKMFPDYGIWDPYVELTPSVETLVEPTSPLKGVSETPTQDAYPGRSYITQVPKTSATELYRTKSATEGIQISSPTSLPRNKPSIVSLEIGHNTISFASGKDQNGTPYIALSSETAQPGDSGLRIGENTVSVALNGDIILGSRQGGQTPSRAGSSQDEPSKVILKIGHDTVTFTSSTDQNGTPYVALGTKTARPGETGIRTGENTLGVTLDGDIVLGSAPISDVAGVDRSRQSSRTTQAQSLGSDEVVPNASLSSRRKTTIGIDKADSNTETGQDNSSGNPASSSRKKSDGTRLLDSLLRSKVCSLLIMAILMHSLRSLMLPLV
jgi:hypothetical protein